jgi:diaminohydroxyphosphoribosylaminopyrimidine deaminase / 5-amino-6-(5-phosphoribosylamino)uracil reductase
MASNDAQAALDAEMMARALELGRHGDPSPNPHVGALVVHGKEIIAEGFHKEPGSAHAENVAIAAAGTRARGATLYITLEPSYQEGRPERSVDAILAAGIRRVVIGCQDPSPHVEGGGAARLREAGLEVIMGVQEAEARTLIEAWTKYITEGASYLTLKLGVSLDGRIATRTGESKWITCEESRAKAHALRARHDVVMVGINTALADDPALTVRDAPGRSPVRCVVDSKLRLPTDSQLVLSARETPTVVITTFEASDAVAEALTTAGVAVVRVPATAEGRCDMVVALRELAAREVVSVVCEGGAELAGSLLAHRLPSRLHVFVAPVLLGPRGKPGAVDWAGPESPSAAPRIDKPSWELCGTDAHVHGRLVYPKRKA